MVLNGFLCDVQNAIASGSPGGGLRALCEGVGYNRNIQFSFFKALHNGKMPVLGEET